MKLNGWHRIGIILSVLWLVISTFIYFEAIQNSRSKYSIDIPSNCYNWVDYHRAKGLFDGLSVNKNFKQPGKIKIALPKPPKDYVVDQKPSFKLTGYLFFILTPIIIIYLILMFCTLSIKWIYAGFKN